MKFVGRKEKVCFQQLSDKYVVAKIDTGAYGIALHADNIRIEDNKLIFFSFDKEHIFSNYKTIEVKNSFGESQIRYSIKTSMLIGDISYNVDVSLTSRSLMKYSILIGRKFLRQNEYFVDVSKKYINDRA
jgi:hypothetical protein